MLNVVYMSGAYTCTYVNVLKKPNSIHTWLPSLPTMCVYVCAYEREKNLSSFEWLLRMLLGAAACEDCYM